MKNIVFSITPNPSLDLGGIVDSLIPNEKSYVHDEIRSPGGNAINAARILTRLKTPVLATGFLGGSTGVEVMHLLDDEGVRNNFVNIKEYSRICVTVSNQATHRQTRLTFPGPHITKREKEDLFNLFESQKNISLLVVGGSLPSGLNPSDILRLMKIARGRKIECIIDCPGIIMRTLISGKPMFIKPNLTEFQIMTGSKVKSIASVEKEARKLLNRLPFICVSSVEGGALLVCKANSYFGGIPKVKIQSTVGAGDSMVGAMAAQFFKHNKSVDDILRWGLAAAAATLSHPGTAFGSAREIRLLYKSVSVKKIHS